MTWWPRSPAMSAIRSQGPSRAAAAELTDVSARMPVQARSIRTIPAGHPAAGAKAWLFVDEVVVNGSAAEAAGDLTPAATTPATDQAGRVANDAGHKAPPPATAESPPAEFTVGSGELYDEAYRPQFHFTYKKGWLSDINGLYYHEGEYHFFSQYCPAGPGLDYGNIHWGHAVSEDLIHWTERPAGVGPRQGWADFLRRLGRGGLAKHFRAADR